MRFCVHCGKQINEKENKCSFCSNDVSENYESIIIKSNIECIKCHSKNIESKIVKKIETGITKEDELYICKDCGKQFTDKSRLGSSFNNNPQIILNSLEKRILKWIIIIIIAIIIISNNLSNKINEENSWIHYDCSGVPEMTFKQIKEGAPNDDNKYKGNTYTFTTTIEEISGRKVITPIEEGDYTGSYIYFNNEDKEKLKNYKPGDTITFCGTVTKISMYHKVYVNNASLIY